MSFANELAKLNNKLQRQLEAVKRTTEVIAALTEANVPKSTVSPWTLKLDRQTKAADATKTTINVLNALSTKNSKTR